MTYNKIELESILVKKYYDELKKTDTLLGQIQSVSVIHGGGILYENKETQKRHKTEMRILSTSSDLKNEVIRNYRIDEFSIFMNELVNMQMFESSKMIIDETSSICEFTGNVMDKRGGEMNYDYFLKVIEKISIRFDKEGMPIMPTVFCGKVLFEKMSKMTSTLEQEENLKKIIQLKKEEWYANKHYRKLSYIY
jgi:hypothetical protein